jgi:hypothetical protein
LTAGDAHQDAAAAVSGYAETLQWAQGQAGTAAHQWDEAQTATEAALNQYNTNAAAGVRQRRTPVRRSGPVFPVTQVHPVGIEHAYLPGITHPLAL